MTVFATYRDQVTSGHSNGVAADWPDLLGIVEDGVFPVRRNLNRKSLLDRWWHYAEKWPGLNRTIKGLDRVLAISRVGQHPSFCFLPNGMAYADRLIILPSDSYSAFCTLPSRLHEIWIRKLGSTLRDDPAYTPSDCFETFPFLLSWSSDPRLDTAGKKCHEFRAELVQRNGEGLTNTRNRFHDRYENHPDIGRLRQLHEEMDRTVLSEYVWDDIAVKCEFLPDLEPEEESTSKRFWRYRWPDEVHDEYLAA